MTRASVIRLSSLLILTLASSAYPCCYEPWLTLAGDADRCNPLAYYQAGNREDFTAVANDPDGCSCWWCGCMSFDWSIPPNVIVAYAWDGDEPMDIGGYWGYPSDRGFRFTAPALYTIPVHAHDDEGLASNEENARVLVFRNDIQVVGGVPYVGVGELVPVKLVLQPIDEINWWTYVRLTLSTHSIVKVWGDPQRTILLIGDAQMQTWFWPAELGASGKTVYVEGLNAGTVRLTQEWSNWPWPWGNFPGGLYNGDSVDLTVLTLEMNPTSGPVGTVVTLTLVPAGTGLLSPLTTASATGRYVCEGYPDTTETTVSHPADKVHYNPTKPNEVKIVMGDVLPDDSWFVANPQIFQGGLGSFVGRVSLHMGAVNASAAINFLFYAQAELGTLDGTTFTPVGLIISSQRLIAQILVKDDGLGSPPDSLTVVVQSYDANGNRITAPPTSDYADPSLTAELTKVTTGGIPGFHTYRSSPDAPIVPYAHELAPGRTINENRYIYIVDNGSLRIEY